MSRSQSVEHSSSDKLTAEGAELTLLPISQLGHSTSRHLIIVPESSWLSLRFRELWEYRELLIFLGWRDVKVRYSQTVLGALWAIIQPLTTMVIFSIVFGTFAQLPSDGLPYTVFTYTALLPWNLFSTSVGRSTQSVVGSSNLISKVYFPRLIVPISSLIAPIVDFGIAFLILIGMMFWYNIALTPRIITLPFLIIFALLTSLAVGLWCSAMNVKYRDVGYVIPFLLQIWMYASPVAYSSSLIPEEWRWLYGLNPMTGVIEGFRWALLGTTWDQGSSIVLSVIVVLVLSMTGLLFFRRMEESFADIV